jgi:hypothetical protein
MEGLRVSQFTEKQNNRVESGPIGIALLNEIAERLLALENLAKATQPIGAVEPIEKFLITDVRRHMPLQKPWFSVSIINDDDHNDVFCIVNTEKSFEEHRIHPLETYNINMVTAVIKDLLFWCDHGESAIVRIVGTR